MSERVEYEHGRSDGYAEGAYDAQWRPHVANDRVGQLLGEVRLSRETGCQRAARAFYAGMARGYREAIGKGGRT